MPPEQEIHLFPDDRREIASSGCTNCRVSHRLARARRICLGAMLPTEAVRAAGMHDPAAALNCPLTAKTAARTPKAPTNPNTRTRTQLLMEVPHDMPVQRKNGER